MALIVRSAQCAVRKKVRLYSGVLLLALFFLAPCFAQTSNPQTPVVVSINRKKVMQRNGRTMPLLWADGIARVADLDAYKATGFNVVVVRLGWRPTDDGALVATDLKGPRDFAEAAAERGMHIVYALPPAPLGQERAFRVAADSPAYFLLWSSWVNDAMTRLRDTPNLLGWMLPDDPRALPFAGDVGFSRWLRENFAAVGTLNSQWKSDYEDFDAVTIASVEALINAWQNPDDGADAVSLEAANRRLEADKSPRGDNSWAWHPAALALAHFRWESYRALVARWAQTIKAIDPLHPVLSGRIPDYAQLLAMPPDVDIVVPDVEPGLAETDWATHNPQAVDIARRGGHFAAAPVFLTRPSREMPAEALAQVAPMWMQTALAHGASGMAWSSWDELLANAPLRKAIEKTLKALQSTPEFGLWNTAPHATAAVLLTPLADGHTLQIERDAADNPVGMARGLYGFGENLVSGEPSDLVYALRWGTAFGSVDFLSPDDADDATLARYSTVLMPQALSVGETQMAALAKWVGGGGALVADLGIGAAQDGWQAMSFPPQMSLLFGVAPPTMMRAMPFNLRARMRSPLFPTWSGGAREGSVLTAGDGPGASAFSGPVTFARLLQGAQPLALGARLTQPFPPPGANSPANPALRFLEATLSLRPQGAGFAIYAPFRLWTFWRPSHLGFAPFHGDLFARGAAVVQLDAGAFVPSPSGESPLYPQVINFPNAIALLNHAPQIAGAPLQTAILQTVATGPFLWSNSACVWSADGAVPPGVAPHPAPVENLDAYLSRPRLVTLHASVAPQSLKALRILPVAAQNLGGGGLTAHVARYDKGGARILLWPNATNIAPNGGDFLVTVVKSSPARLTLWNSSDYSIAPNSRHRVTVTELVAPPLSAAEKKKNRIPPLPIPRTQIASADAGGKLVLELATAAASIEISPAQ